MAAHLPPQLNRGAFGEAPEGMLLAPTEVSTAENASELAVKTVFYKKHGAEGASGRVSLLTFKQMIARWEIGPDDYIRLDGDSVERRVRELPAFSPLDEMLRDALEKVLANRRGDARRTDVIRQLEMLREYAEYNDRVFAVVCFFLGWLRYAESPGMARGLFLKALERGYPVTSVARNNLAVAQIRLGDPAGRDNLILAANDPRRSPVALRNLARLLQHLQALGENTEEIANIKDLLRVARAEWRKSPPEPGDPGSYALFLCEGDIPASFASETRTLAMAQGQIEGILAEGEECLRHSRLEQAMAHAARAASEIERAREELSRDGPRKGTSPLRFLCVRLSRLEKGTAALKEIRENKGQLEMFRRRLRALEESLKLKVPPGDLIQQAEILVDSARSEGERNEASNILRECQDRVARHLLDTGNDLLLTGEKEVAVGLFKRALAFGSREGDEIKLRLANIRRDELLEEITRSISQGRFDEGKAKIAQLRTIHPIFEPICKRLDAEVKASEAAAMVDRVVSLCGAEPQRKDSLEEARRWFEVALALHPNPSSLGPIEDQLVGLEAKLGLEGKGTRKVCEEGKE